MKDNEDNRACLSANESSAARSLQLEMVKGSDESGSVDKDRSKC